VREPIVPTLIEGPSITSRTLRGFDEYFAAHGKSFGAFAARLGIDADVVRDPDGFLPIDKVLEAFEAAAIELHDEAFGVHVAEVYSIRSAGLYHYITANAPTVRAALEISVTFAALVVSAYRVSFEATPSGGGVYTWHGPEYHGPRRQFLGFVATLLVARARHFANDATWMPRMVALAHAAPRDSQEFTRVLGPNVTFDSRETSVSINKDDLDRPIETADATLFAELQRAGARSPMAPSGIDAALEQVRAALIDGMPRQDVSEAAIASRLALSTRTLQRVLADAGTTFELLRDDVRKRATYQYLADSDVSLTEIAYLVGFSELSAFSRAARAWFGEPASSLRKRLRQG
jgi:AraC-like DNA-binding protein